MSSKRVFYILCIVLVLSITGGGAAIHYGQKYLAHKSNRLNQLKAESRAIEVVQQSLANAKRDIEKYADIEMITQQIVPQEKDQARTVRELITIADRSNIKISSIIFPTSTLGANEKTAANQPQSGTVTQTKKVEGLDKVERLEITIQSQSKHPVLFSDFIYFMRELEKNRRTSQVSGITITPSKDGSRLHFSLTLNIYIKKKWTYYETQPIKH